MNMQEVTRLIKALRAEGWDGDSIADLLLYLEAGDIEYQPRSQRQSGEKQ